MASFDDYQMAVCGGGGGWWNPGRSVFPPCSAPLSDFLWSVSSMNYVDEEATIKHQSATAATYSRFDDSSNDHNSSSATSSNYAQLFQHDGKPEAANFSSSDWSQNTLQIPGCYNSDHQFETAAKLSLMGLENSASFYANPAMLQTLHETDMSYVFDSSFTSTANWHKILSPSPKQQLIGGTKHSNTNNLVPFCDSWMGSDEIGILENHGLQSPSLFEDNIKQPYCGLMSPEIGSKDMTQKQVAVSTLLGAKRKNATNDETCKRLRIETTPSSLPAFKVRKEKLGDRITALQQLVSPFGKTDTASVLHEAIEYIKFLHDQVLRSPYMQNGKQAGPKLDLISRGLCLVPISSTFTIANETTADFWTPTFG